MTDTLAYDITKEKMVEQEIDRRAEAKPEPPDVVAQVEDASVTPPVSEASEVPAPEGTPGPSEGEAPADGDQAS